MTYDFVRRKDSLTFIVLCFCLFVAFCFQSVPLVRAELTYIQNRNMMPSWTQAGNYVADYQGRNTDLGVTYDNLAADPDVRRINWRIYRDPLHSGDDFTSAHYTEIIRGDFHCSPTVTAIWMRWYRVTKWFWIRDLGGEDASISAFAEYENTNDQNPNKPGHNPGEVHIGTFDEKTDEFTSGVNDYLWDSSWWKWWIGYRVEHSNWDWTRYKWLIDNNYPPIIFFDGTRVYDTGHTVVGVGHNATHVFYIDPLDGLEYSIDYRYVNPAGPGGAGNYPHGEQTINSISWYETVTYWLNATEKSVGGIWVPVDKFGLLAPYIGLASTIIVATAATAATAIYVKHVKHRKEE